ncbi:hypothetical protein KUTeg_022878 [Tegillarca granosa]|uniref:Mitochondrial ribosomal protein L1 n=1 Tax=Tegillarca granosa TaxID=220873 RepID=A0ABQ9E036_TEGGR|nr:hypothetical protein KUTeg_022878 [Tegillarca granosa]
MLVLGSFLCRNLKTTITKATVCQINQIRLKNKRVHLKAPKEGKDEKKQVVIRRERTKVKTEIIPEFEDLKIVDHKYDYKPVEDVYIQAYYKSPEYTLTEIVTMHSETLQPAMMNSMNSMLYAEMKLDLRTKKKTKFSSEIRTVLSFPHDFEHGKVNRLAVFCEGKNEEDLANDLGAHQVGGKKLVDDLFNKHITDLGVDIVLTTPDFYSNLLKIRTVLGKYMPNRKAEGLLTVSDNIEEMMTAAKHGVIIESHKTDDQGVATLQAPFARLSMSYEQIYENLRTLCDIVASFKDGSISTYITSLAVLAPPSREKFLLNLKTDEFKDKEIPKTKSKQNKKSEKEHEEEIDDEDEEEKL